MKSLTQTVFVAATLVAVVTVCTAQKVKFNEFTIKKTSDKASPLVSADANCIIAVPFQPSAAHVKVFDGTRQGAIQVRAFSGKLDPDPTQIKMGDGSVRTLNFSVSSLPAARSASGNNLKQMSLASINASEMKIGMLAQSGDRAKEYRTFYLKGVKVKSGERPNSFVINFTGLETAPCIGSANGGVWKTTNGGASQAILIGLLLPAVQKIR